MNKRIKKIIAADIALYLAGMGTFLAFHYIVPYSMDTAVVITDTVSAEQFSLPEKSGEDEIEGNTASTHNEPADKDDKDAALKSESGSEKKNFPKERPENMPDFSGDKPEGFGDMPSFPDGMPEAFGEKPDFPDGMFGGFGDFPEPPSDGGERKKPSSDGDGSEHSHRPSGKHGDMGFADNNETTEIASDNSQKHIESVDMETVASERNDTADVTVKKCTFGSGEDTVTYYLADIYVTSATQIKTAFANGSYGKNIRSNVDEMAKENNAVLAVSGDYYGNSEDGIVIRNGTLYRDNTTNADICVLFTDGTMKTYSPSEFNADEVIAAGAWQAWTFGPALLDGNGNIPDTFNTNSYIYGNNPRCAIGMIAPGHYVFVVVDGRNKGYSKGVDLTALAEIMADAGCTCAYNLDGGNSSAMYFGDGYISEPSGGGREISDIIYIGQGEE